MIDIYWDLEVSSGPGIRRAKIFIEEAFNSLVFKYLGKRFYGSGASSFGVSLHNGAGSETSHILIIVGPSGPPNGSVLFQEADAKRASSASIKQFPEIFEREWVEGIFYIFFRSSDLGTTRNLQISLNINQS